MHSPQSWLPSSGTRATTAGHMAKTSGSTPEILLPLMAALPRIAHRRPWPRRDEVVCEGREERERRGRRGAGGGKGGGRKRGGGGGEWKKEWKWRDEKEEGQEEEEKEERMEGGGPTIVKPSFVVAAQPLQKPCCRLCVILTAKNSCRYSFGGNSSLLSCSSNRPLMMVPKYCHISSADMLPRLNETNLRKKRQGIGEERGRAGLQFYKCCRYRCTWLPSNTMSEFTKPQEPCH